jgi:hypothetical protein
MFTFATSSPKPAERIVQRRGGDLCWLLSKGFAVVQLEPDSVALDSDQFDRIRRILKRVGITSPHTAQALSEAVAATMSTYRIENVKGAGVMTYREKHDSLRALWRLTEEPDPPVGQIRARLRAFPDEILVEIEERAERRWSVHFEEQAPTTPTKGWLAQVPEDKLLKILPTSISYGGQWVPGRGRGTGRRSGPQYEPMILGVVRGSQPPSRLATGQEARGRSRADARPNGRPSDDAGLQLISFLAFDWALATEQRPVPGRSDKTPFSDLVHQVFGWLGLPDATGALRRYWREWARAVERQRLQPTA